MDWTNGFAANDGLRRTAAIAAFGAGSLYVIYSLLDGYIKKTPAPQRTPSNVHHLKSTTPEKSPKISFSNERSDSFTKAHLDLVSQEECFTEHERDSRTETLLDEGGLPESAPEQIEEQTDQLTELIENLKYKGARVINEDEVDCLGFLLTTNIESLLCETLGILSNCSAFTTNQNRFREQGVINQVKRLTRHENDAIKIQALTATANLCVNDENQAEFIDEIPYYLELAFREGCSMLSIVALYVLTNLTVKFGSNEDVLKHANLLASKAVCASKDESLQAMKVLVNISCEEEGAEYLVKANLREDFFDLIRSEAPISQRCLTVLANLIPKVPEGSALEDRIIELKPEMLAMWRANELEEAQKDQLRRTLKALSVRGWGRLSESTMDLVNRE